VRRTRRTNKDLQLTLKSLIQRIDSLHSELQLKRVLHVSGSPTQSYTLTLEPTKTDIQKT
jgi:hypothetical protein